MRLRLIAILQPIDIACSETRCWFSCLGAPFSVNITKSAPASGSGAHFPISWRQDRAFAMSQIEDVRPGETAGYGCS
jgi:hypothetical protein